MENVRVKVTNIKYVTSQDKELPTELDLEFYFDENEQEFEEVLSSLINDEVDCQVCSFEFQII